MGLAQNWESRSVVTGSTISKMSYSMKNMITRDMRPILHVLNDKQHMKTVKAQFRGYFEFSQEAVRCWEKEGDHIEYLMNAVTGNMLPSKFKTEINDSYIGKLNKYLAVLRTYVEEEMDENIR